MPLVINEQDKKLNYVHAVIKIDKISEAKITLSKPDGIPIQPMEYPIRINSFLPWGLTKDASKVDRKWVLRKIFSLDPRLKELSDNRHFNFVVEHINRTEKERLAWLCAKVERNDNDNNR